MFMFADKIEPHIVGFVGYDLDGTLRCPESEQKFINTPTDQKRIQGALESTGLFSYFLLDRFGLERVRNVGITNQQGVKWGYKSLNDCIQEQRITLELFPVLEYILFCPDDGQTCWKVDRQGSVDVTDPEISGSYRKPGTGMLQEATEGLPPFEENWWFIGDRDSDKEAAQAAGFNFIWSSDWLRGDYTDG
jgi:D-glycero-D-manno-heptose 1,7-bisphosphate phosphatase